LQDNADVNRFETPPAVRAFSVLPRLSFSGRNNSHINYISSSWTNQPESNQSGVAVLDVAIPTGYYMQQQVLDEVFCLEKCEISEGANFLITKLFSI
jgi:CD109 antigen